MWWGECDPVDVFIRNMLSLRHLLDERCSASRQKYMFRALGRRQDWSVCVSVTAANTSFGWLDQKRTGEPSQG